MKFTRIASLLPAWKNALLALASAILLILAFPDFEYWFLAWFALVPLLLAIERERDSTIRSFVLGWLFGVVFFFGTCWWLTYAPVHYAGFPVLLAYFLLFCVTALVGVFPGIFAAIVSILLRHFGSWAFLAAPFAWVTTEFARYWITGNNWNAVGYSQAFTKTTSGFAQFGGIYMVGILPVVLGALLSCWLAKPSRWAVPSAALVIIVTFSDFGIVRFIAMNVAGPHYANGNNEASVVAVQPNVPMSGLDPASWERLRARQIQLAANKASELNTPQWTRSKPGEPVPVDAPEFHALPILVVLPESPMNFMWGEDLEFQEFIKQFAAKNNVSVLFNSAEPDPENKRYFNSAVLISAEGKEIAEYDKIYLLPFGESVPAPLQSIVPAFVGNFSYGKNYSLVPVGDAKAGIMICFESHFGELSREYVRRGADVIIEMTNDGYLGPTPVLRQHLANAVFRAIETNRPVLRVTNVGITAYITERGEVLDATQPYTEDTRVWSVAKSDGSQTFYVRYGDCFAWLCSIITAVSLVFAIWRKKPRTS